MVAIPTCGLLLKLKKELKGKKLVKNTLTHHYDLCGIGYCATLKFFLALEYFKIGKNNLYLFFCYGQNLHTVH